MATQKLSTVVHNGTAAWNKLLSDKDYESGTLTEAENYYVALLKQYTQLYAKNTVALLPQVIDDRSDTQLLADYVEALTNARKDFMSLEICKKIFASYGHNGIQRIWEKGVRSAAEVNKMWIHCGEDIDKFLRRLELK